MLVKPKKIIACDFKPCSKCGYWNFSGSVTCVSCGALLL